MKSKIIFKKEAGEVIKICNSPAEFKKELAIYRRNLDFTPQLIDHDKRIKLILQYLPGQRVSDMDQPEFSKLAQLFLKLHKVSKEQHQVICQVDTNPKNYLVGKNQYYMVDFSEWEWNVPELDLINFLLFWASRQQAYQFRQTCKVFLKTYHQSSSINMIEWELLLSELIHKFDWRRKNFGKKERILNSDVGKNREYLQNINTILQ
jgi:hypothetical protein